MQQRGVKIAMAQKIAERLQWAVETLAVAPIDHLLEIGCGHGLAVSLICEKLTSGTITAIDRSEKMINLASKRNRTHVSSGKARFQSATLDEANFGNDQFDKIFAVRVNLFSQQPAKQLEIIKNHLKPKGKLYLFDQPPVPNKSQQLVESVSKTLRDHGFSIQEVLSKELKPVRVTCVIAKV